MSVEKNIVLIGFMGAGKTTVGRTIAQKLGWSFIDTDQEIERLIRMPVHEIFRRYGEKRFRSEENLLARKLAERQRLVIATGGGIVQNPANVELLKKNGVFVWLKVSPEMVIKRVGRRAAERPLLRGKLTLDEVSRLLAEREEIYARIADIVVENENHPLEEMAGEIIARWREHTGRAE